MFVRSILIWFMGCGIFQTVRAQQDSTGGAADSLLGTVTVKGYLRDQQLWQTPASVGLLSQKQLELASPASLVASLNTIPGVRMEERSPGSYRLSIRGSLVRSPYGVRNVKIYYNGFSLTDAGGNTYLNILNASDITKVEVLKGPDGSIFGANSGGVVLLGTETERNNPLDAKIFGGSYGQAGEALRIQKQKGAHLFRFLQSYQRADGYREHSNNHRLFFQVGDKWQYSRTSYLEALAFYSRLYYSTPGGLTQLQYDSAPRMARPATPTLPGAAEQKAGIYTDMLFAGLRNHTVISPMVDFTTALWGSHINFKNPFITNYEHRKENNIGFRTYFSFHKSDIAYAQWRPGFYIGAEGQRLVTDVTNYENNGGLRGKLQAYSNIISYQLFGFARARMEWKDRFVAELATSINYNGYHFRDTTQLRDHLYPVWMPHLGLNYRMVSFLEARVTLSRGYSTPTTAEVRPSNNIIYTQLEPEKGWNTEAGFRFRFWQNRLTADASVYHYSLKDGIVSQQDEGGNIYFVNAGKIRQVGVEYAISWQILPLREKGFLRLMQWNSNYTYAFYRYVSYVLNGDDFSGNRVAGVPRTVWVNSLQMAFPCGVNLFIQHNFTGRLPLDNANTAFAEKYHLLYARLVWTVGKKVKYIDRLFFAVDNILNQKYGLGNDINAVGNRFYNAAPERNIQAGMIIGFH